MAKIFAREELRADDKPIREIFFEAMLAGYVSEHPPEPQELVVFPGSKHLEYERGLWRVTDTWDAPSESDYSSGKTLIYYRDEPVWVMQYYGQYPQSALPILKAALRSSYLAGEFSGGRGVDGFAHPDGKYLNFRDPYYHSFRSFRGTEVVLVSKTDETGSHFYHGGLKI